VSCVVADRAAFVCFLGGRGIAAKGQWGLAFARGLFKDQAASSQPALALCGTVLCFLCDASGSPAALGTCMVGFDLGFGALPCFIYGRILPAREEAVG